MIAMDDYVLPFNDVIDWNRLEKLSTFDCVFGLYVEISLMKISKSCI